jgi:hypothetical protein
LIVDLAEPERRGEAVGAYYLARGLLVAPAPILGGALWGVSPQLAFGAAAVAGTASVALFSGEVRGRLQWRDSDALGDPLARAR